MTPSAAPLAPAASDIDESYLTRARRLVAAHPEAFSAPQPRMLRLVPPAGQPPRPQKPHRSRSRQLALPLPPAMLR